MRNFLYLFLAVGLFLTTGCGSDDDGAAVSITADDLVGTWNVNDYDTDLTISGNFLGQDFSDNSTSSIANSALQITFTDAGTWSSAGDYDLIIMTSDTTETTTENGAGGGTYTISGSTVTLEGLDAGDEADFGSQIFTVTSFTAGSSVDLRGDVDQSITDPIFGATIDTRGTVEMKLRQ